MCHPRLCAHDESRSPAGDRSRTRFGIKDDATAWPPLRSLLQRPISTHRHPLGGAIQGQSGRYTTLSAHLLPVHRTQPYARSHGRSPKRISVVELSFQCVRTSRPTHNTARRLSRHRPSARCPPNGISRPVQKCHQRRRYGRHPRPPPTAKGTWRFAIPSPYRSVAGPQRQRPAARATQTILAKFGTHRVSSAIAARIMNLTPFPAFCAKIMNLTIF